MATEVLKSSEPARRTLVPRLLSLVAVVAILGTAVIAYAQWFAKEADHQNANMISLVVGAATILTVVVLVGIAAALRGWVWQVPLAAVGLLLVLSAIFQYDGFSGEMMPQFKFRFTESPELERLAGRKASAQPAEPESLSADANSLGLLGTDRTGVIEHRQFSVPSSSIDVEELWNHGVGEGWSSFAVSDDRVVTLEQRDDLECLIGYRLADGKLIWNVNHEARHEHVLGGIGPRTTPSIHEGRVYAQGATGHVWCVDLQTGKVIWEADLLKLAGWDQTASEARLTWGRSGSPLIVDGLCIVPYGGPDTIADQGRTLIALDAQTGAVRWTSGTGQPSYASPDLVTLAGVRQLVSVNEKTITGHKIDDGSVLWEFIWPGGSNGAANCAKIVFAGDDQFLIGKGYGGGSALVKVNRGDDGVLAADAVWESTRVLKTKFTHACVVGDVAYAISNGSLEAVRISDGVRLWTQPRRSRFGQGQILIAEDTIVAQAESGEVVLVAADPKEYHELFRIPAMNAKTWNIPTIAGRYLLVRNDRQAICFRLPAR